MVVRRASSPIGIRIFIQKAEPTAAHIAWPYFELGGAYNAPADVAAFWPAIANLR